MVAESAVSNGFLRGDPFTWLSRRVFRFGPGVAALVVVLLINGPVVFISAIDGSLLTTGSTVGLLHDPGYWWLQVVVVGITAFAYLWLPDGLDTVLSTLVRNRVIVSASTRATDEAFTEYRRAFERWYGHVAWHVVAVCGGLLYVAMIVPVQRLYDTWQNASAWAFWWTVGGWFVVALLVITLGVRLVVAIVWLNRLFSVFRAQVRVMHPDGAGGLAPLGHFSVRIGYFVAGYGLGIVGGFASEAAIRGLGLDAVFVQSYALTLITVYVLIAPLIFFAPFILAHRAMKHAKDEFIVTVSERLEIELPRLKEVVRTGGKGSELRDGVDEVEQLRTLYDFGRRFPVWPFNPENLWRFMTSIAAPVAAAAFSLLVDFVR